MPHPIRSLEMADLADLIHLRDVSFGGHTADGDSDARERLAGTLPFVRGAYLDGKLASAAHMYPFEMFLSSQRVRCGGLAGVVTSPLARRRGLVRALLADGLARLAAEGVGWCLEYPFDPRFYARYGFRSIPVGTELALPSATLLRGAPPDGERLRATDAGRLGPLHAAFAARFSFALTRDDGVRDAWGRTILRMFGGKPHHAYLLEDAYLLFHQESRTEASGMHLGRLVVRDFAYTSPAGRANLLAFLGGFHGQVEEVLLRLPPDDPLVLDWAGRYGRHAPAFQARVADLAAALAPFAREAEGGATITVRDDFCDWNDGTFRLVWGPAGTHVERSTGAADASVDIAALAPLLVGAMTAEAAVALGLAAGSLAALRAVAALNGARPAFMSTVDYF